MNRTLRIAVCALAVAAAAGAATAQTARSGGNANAQVLQQMQELASERTSLQAENEKLKGELAAAKKDRDSLQASEQAVDKRAKDATAALAHTRTEHDATAQELTQTKAKMQELIAKFRETIQKLREVEAENAAGKQSLAAREHELAVCTDHNQNLYRLDDEVLTHFEKQSAFSRLAQAEPFTRIKRVELENYVDDSRARAQDLRVPVPAKSPAATPGAPLSGTSASPQADPGTGDQPH
jgi:chromosome segregation ATPase